MRDLRRSVFSSIAMALPLAAQCAARSQPEGAVGTDGEVFAVVRWDPDGAGPSSEGVVCGGAFLHAGAIAATNVALLDPSTGRCEALGSGVDGSVRCAVVLPTGVLVVGGEFTTAGGQPAAGIARWNGTAWSSSPRARIQKLLPKASVKFAPSAEKPQSTRNTASREKATRKPKP